jgi:hypothetical protein
MSGKGKFCRFRISKNWEDKDCLGKEYLKDKDRIEVKWPNGTTTSHVVSIERSHTTVLEQNQRFETHIPITRAFITLDHNGTKIKARVTSFKKALGRFI